MPADRQAAAAQMFKDPYVLDFFDVGPEMHERHLERALIDKIKDLLLELGTGFAFVGSLNQLLVGDKPFYLDLLYHTKLHSQDSVRGRERESREIEAMMQPYDWPARRNVNSVSS